MILDAKPHLVLPVPERAKSVTARLHKTPYPRPRRAALYRFSIAPRNSPMATAFQR